MQLGTYWLTPTLKERKAMNNNVLAKKKRPSLKFDLVKFQIELNEFLNEKLGEDSKEKAIILQNTLAIFKQEASMSNNPSTLTGNRIKNINEIISKKEIIGKISNEVIQSFDENNFPDWRTKESMIAKARLIIKHKLKKEPGLYLESTIARIFGELIQVK